ncbi:hypothetical protein [Sphingomonas paeninsulae]|nr:hypothetical protein [Sphingomonas paeninsulae]
MNMHSAIYPDAPGHRGIDTSIEAADAIAAVAGPLRRLVYAAIYGAGSVGLTTDEIAVALDMHRYSVQPRTSELKCDHRIEDSGRRRKNASGCNAIVWVVT